jgi:hypothetical protein
MKAEPAVIAGIVAAVINAVALLVFGQELTTEQEAAIVGVVTTVAAFYIRSQVTPTG